ncbi:MAG: PSD1 and planctomycete cytochrome C domain-containing protein [Isosphaeraceae bacterium]
MTQPRLDGVGDSSQSGRSLAIRRSIARALCVLVSLAVPASAADEAKGIAFFESKIRHVLVERCQECHSRSLAKPKGRLRLDTREGLRQGGSLGSAVIPGDSGASPLFLAITAADGYEPMPPKGKLPASVVADFRRWIEMGAPDPRDGTGKTSTASAPEASPNQGRDWWSLRPIARPKVPPIEPSMAGWARTPIDRFILARLAEKGLQPSRPADRRTLIRRLSFDLIGLPPTLAEIAAFLDDQAPDAYERLVDRLLASPHYGERWARHWMDVVHFAETHGHDQDRIRPNAWPYRDYLISAFNRDTPYARFVREQVAADALFPDEPGLVVALGMIAAGPWDESSLRDIRGDSIDRQIGHYIDRDDMVGTVMSTFVSATVQCARCHDHKFDPISQSDYYSLQAVFAGVDKAERGYDTDPSLARLRRTLASEVKNKQGTTPSLSAWVGAELSALPPQPLVFAAASEFAPDGSHKPPGGPRPVHLLRRGDIHQPGPPAPPGTLSCVAGLPSRFPASAADDESARRDALARWLTDQGNPLTWRSIVNRVWHYHFDRGIVATPNDFGRMGSTPSHPELLDWLAATFRDSGGSLKQLHRLIVTSAVYRQETRDDPSASAVDSDDAWLWRQRRRRLDAESIHDAILMVAGRLDTTMGGPSVRQFALSPGVHVTPIVNYTRYDWDSPGSSRRSVYRFLFRTLPDPFFDALDAADSSQLIAVRNESTTPLQALAMFNNPFVLRQCEHFARRLETIAPSIPGRIEAAFELACGRPPTDEEVALLSDYARRHGLANACRLIVNSNEFLFVN